VPLLLAKEASALSSILFSISGAATFVSLVRAILHPINKVKLVNKMNNLERGTRLVHTAHGFPVPR
jgi:hypothetical protein